MHKRLVWVNVCVCHNTNNTTHNPQPLQHLSDVNRHVYTREVAVGCSKRPMLSLSFRTVRHWNNFVSAHLESTLIPSASSSSSFTPFCGGPRRNISSIKSHHRFIMRGSFASFIAASIDPVIIHPLGFADAVVGLGWVCANVALTGESLAFFRFTFFFFFVFEKLLNMPGAQNMN